MSGEWLILGAVGLPLLASLLIWLTGGSPNQRETVTLAAAVTLFVIVGSMLPLQLAGAPLRVELLSPVPGVAIAFEVEPLGMTFACVASFLWIVNSVFSIGYMRGNDEPRQTRFYVCFAIALGSTMGLAFAENLFTLFLCYESLTLSTYPLVTHHKNDEARRSGRTYLALLLGTSVVLLLPAIIATWVLTGSLSFEAGGIMAGKVSPLVGGILLLVFMYGIGKAALMPMHRWLPAAMVAPTPVSALLHAVAVVKAGVFTVVKVTVYIFGLDYLRELATADLVLYLAGFTIITASVIALRQDNLKRRLAYSTVSQLSYVILAALILSPLSTMGALLHIAVHAFGKITLFMAAGAIYTAAHKTEVSQLAGIGRRMPWTMGAFAVGALSMIGVPPAAGFLSKWYMLLGALQVEQFFAVAVIVVSTLLNAAYFLPIVHAAFLKPEASGGQEPTGPGHGEAPLPIVLALVTTAAGTLLLFLFPGPALELANMLVGR
ncbi:MAG: monovalent cation/H+ antiporter subunit D family protein [Alphaproteobacteria bacterium]|nr:monovalent cation/H+ antiporter subunit D family protein [Alphaproteobacteria bacterium]MDP6814430.1 monovalent cation/H+ antiporter subunit D family protein [Alphaproteobacteria bacterium]